VDWTGEIGSSCTFTFTDAATKTSQSKTVTLGECDGEPSAPDVTF
jgi:hypothetical protein